MSNDTVSRREVDEAEFLRQMRRDAVEKYKEQLSAELLKMIKELDNDGTTPRTAREIGIQRGLTNAKMLIQSHKIIVE